MIVTSSLYLGWPVEIRDKSGDGLAVHPCDADFWILNIVLQLKQKFSWTDTSYSPDYNTNLTAPFGTAPCSEVIQRRNKKLGGMYCMIACVESHGVWERQIEQKRWNVTNFYTHCRKRVENDATSFHHLSGEIGSILTQIHDSSAAAADQLFQHSRGGTATPSISK